MTLVPICLAVFTAVNFGLSLQADKPPTFVLTPAGSKNGQKVLYVNPGSNISLSCKAEGTHPLRYRWMYINEAGDFSMVDTRLVLGYDESTGKHTLAHARYLGDRNYSCMVSNKHWAAVTPPVSVIFPQMESFTGSPDDPPEVMTVSASGSISLPCRNVDKLNSKPDAKISWNRRITTDRVDAASRIIMKKNMAVDAEGTLHFLWTEDSDFEYIYTCSAYNPKLQILVTNTHGIYLKREPGNIVPRGPTVLYSCDVTALAGEEARLTCIFSYFSPRDSLEISWLYKGHNVGTGQTLTLPRDDQPMTEAIMHHVYECVARVGNDNSSATVTLTKVSPPVFKPNKDLQYQTVPVGKDATFHCQASFNEEPPVWYINGRRIDLKTVRNFSLSRDSTILTVHDVTKGDQDCFQCSVHNRHGRIYGNGCITVIDRITPHLIPDSVNTLRRGGIVNVKVDATCDDLYLDQLTYEWIVYKADGTDKSKKGYIKLPKPKLDGYLNISLNGKALTINYFNSHGKDRVGIFSMLERHGLSEMFAVKIENPYEQLVLNFTVKADGKDNGGILTTRAPETKPLGDTSMATASAASTLLMFLAMLYLTILN